MVKQRETDMAMTEDKYDFPFGEHHELCNRHMLVNPPRREERTGQVQDK